MTIRYAYDFETYEWVKPLCCAIVGDDDECFIHSNESKVPLALRVLQYMASIVESWEEKDGEEKVQFWAHNGGKFDALLLLEAAADAGYKVEATPAAGRLVRTIISVGNTRIELLDSYAVVQASLKKAVEGFQCETRKLFNEDDYKGDMRALPLDKLRLGCIADCRAVLELLDKVESHIQERGGKLKATFSSSAFSMVTAHLEKEKIPYPSHDGSQWANEISRTAYMGGRVEVFHHMPGAPVAVFDVNSSYPWSMTQKLPWELLGRTSAPTVSGDILDAQSGMVHARVSVPEMHIPPLPYRPKKGGMFFPTGEWAAWFTAVELAYAIEQGCYVEPFEGIYYRMRQPLEGYINSLYRLKQEGTGAKKTFGKLSLNGSYGKMGMKPERDRLLVFPTDEEGLEYEVEHGSERLSKNSYRFQAQAIFAWPKTTHYAMAAHVTAYSRIKLHQYLTTRGVNAAYCDTDSVHDFSSGRSALEQYESAALGLLKYEGTWKRCSYYAPKLYSMEGKENGKGSKDNKYAAKGFTVGADEFSAVVSGNDVPSPRIRLARSQLRQNGAAERLEKETKRWSGLSMKRKTFNDGRTRPWSVEELAEGKHLDEKSPWLR